MLNLGQACQKSRGGERKFLVIQRVARHCHKVLLAGRQQGSKQNALHCAAFFLPEGLVGGTPVMLTDPTSNLMEKGFKQAVVLVTKLFLLSIEVLI